MEGEPYLAGVKSLLSIAEKFSELEFIDLGGGFGVPYCKQEGEERLDLGQMGTKLDQVIKEWVADYGREITFKVEPGRYIAAECGVLLGTVHAIKENYNNKYVGTDLGFNVLIRPTLYDSYHEIEIYRTTDRQSEKKEEVKIVGNICETGDIIADNRMLPQIFEEDIIGVLNAGAYGYVMSSNYNSRLRPAEVLITETGEDVLIRGRETLADL
jgi:diaminopimelate decarboxylase